MVFVINVTILNNWVNNYFVIVNDNVLINYVIMAIMPM